MKNDSMSSFSSQSTLDTNGVDVPLSDPFAEGGGEEPTDCVIWDESGGGRGVGEANLFPMFESGAKCIADGIEMDCVFVSDQAMAQCPDNECSRLGEHGLEFFQAFADGYEGYLTTSQQYLGNGVVFDPHTNDELAGLGRMRPSDGAPQKPGEISEPTNRIRTINTGGNTAFERNRLKVLRRIEWIVNSGSCNAAFKRWGLATPYDLVNNGLVTLSSTEALTSSSYNDVLGQALGTVSGSLPDSAREAMRKKDAPARTLRNDRTGKGIIFFGPDAFDPAYLDEAVPHEFIHVGGQGAKYSWGGWLFGGHDLSGFNQKAYEDIMANCKNH